MMTIAPSTWFHLLQILAVSVPFLVALKCRHKLKSMYYNVLPLQLTGALSQHLPQLKGMPLLGRVKNVLGKDGPLHNMTAAVNLLLEKQHHACYFWAGPQLAVVTTDINLIKSLLKNIHQQVSRNKAFHVISSVLGENIFSCPAEKWQPRRDASKTVFSSNAMKNDYSIIITQLIDKYLNKISQEDIDLFQWTNDLMMDITLGTMLGISIEKLAELDEEKNKLTELLCNIFHFRKIIVFDMPNLVGALFFRRDQIKAKSAKREFYNVLYKVLDKAPEIKEKRSLLITELTKHLGDDNIHGDVLALLFGGPDSSVSTFLSVVRCLDADKAIAKELTEEIQSNNDVQLYLRSEKNLLAKVLKEALRLYPPFIFLTRGVDEPYSFAGTTLPVGTILFFPLLHMQRLESIWGTDALEFKPSRWNNTTTEQLSNYLPFGYGAQNCIAKGFALHVIKQLVYTMVKTTGLPSLRQNEANVFSRKTNSDVTIENGGALKPNHPVRGHFNEPQLGEHYEGI